MSDKLKNYVFEPLEFDDEATQEKDDTEITKLLKKEIENEEKTMTRKEIYDKIFQLLEKEQKHLLKRYENVEISYDNYVELSSAKTHEYQEYIKELALSSDNELNEKMSFIINANIETF